MIQRPQSIFLSLIIILMLALPFCIFWTKVDPQTGFLYMLKPCTLRKFSASGEVLQMDTFPYTIIAILAGLSALIAFYTTFQYKNRIWQLQLSMLNQWIILALIGLLIYFSRGLDNSIIPNVEGKYHFTFLLPVLAVFFNWAASWWIRKDEALVRDANRLR